jgi:hypothetical protein
MEEKSHLSDSKMEKQGFPLQILLPSQSLPAWGLTDPERGLPLTTSLVKENTLAWDSTKLGRVFPLLTLERRQKDNSQSHHTM